MDYHLPMRGFGYCLLKVGRPAVPANGNGIDAARTTRSESISREAHRVGSDDPCSNSLRIVNQALHAPMPRELSEGRRHARTSIVIQEQRQEGEIVG